MEVCGVSEAQRNERPHERLVMWLRQRFCRHTFAIDDLSLTGIPEQEKPIDQRDYKAWERYWQQYWHGDCNEKRVKWPCSKCGRIFYAHCGLNISPWHGPMFRREQPHNSELDRILSKPEN